MRSGQTGAQCQLAGLSDAHLSSVPHMDTLLVDVPASYGPFGAKGVGKPPVVSPVAAVANADSATRRGSESTK
jgi:hypothetical protein